MLGVGAEERLQTLIKKKGNILVLDHDDRLREKQSNQERACTTKEAIFGTVVFFVSVFILVALAVDRSKTYSYPPNPTADMKNISTRYSVAPLAAPFEPAWKGPDQGTPFIVTRAHMLGLYQAMKDVTEIFDEVRI